MSSSDIIDVVTAFCDLTRAGVDPTTFPLELLSDFLLAASIVLDYGFPVTSNIGDHPPPQETPARKVRAMINDLAHTKYCLRCGGVIPSYVCTSDEKESNGYLDGWCPTCDSKFSRNSTISNASVLKAFEFFGLEYIDYDEVEVEENVRQMLLGLQAYYQETGPSFHMSGEITRKSRIHCARMLSGPPRSV